MESTLELFFVFICILVSLTSAAKKAKQRRIYEAAKQSTPAKQEQPKSAPVYTPAQPTILPPLSFGDVPGQAIMPTVHPHVEPDCNTHDIPGSLGVTSMEGKDPCHEEELTLERTIAEPVRAEGGLSFDWSGQNMVKAFVLQEVLTRPVNRAPVGQRRA